jgi:hypothetical protein
VQSIKKGYVGKRHWIDSSRHFSAAERNSGRVSFCWTIE